MKKRSLYKKIPQLDVACTPCMKVKLDDIDGLERENQERISYDGRNIDPDRSGQNLYIHGVDQNKKPIINSKKYTVTLKKRILQKIEKFGAKIRKDTSDANNNNEINGHNTKESVLAEGIIFQLSHDLAMKLLEEDKMLDDDGKIIKGKQLPEESKTFQFFSDTYLFACNRWHAARIVGAYIHLDEYTPHMHLYVVPLCRREKKYRQQRRTDENGQPIHWYTLNAKQMFSKKTIKSLWQDYGKAMAKYGARAATGLISKGEYEKRTSMDVVKAQKQEALEVLTNEVRKRQEENEKLKNELEGYHGIIELMRFCYINILTGLQSVFDKVIGKDKTRVTGYDVKPKIKISTNEYGVETKYTDWTYTVSYERDGYLNQIIVAKDDHYKRLNDPLAQAISKYFLSKLEPASMASQIKTVKTHQPHIIQKKRTISELHR